MKFRKIKVKEVSPEEAQAYKEIHEKEARLRYEKIYAYLKSKNVYLLEGTVWEDTKRYPSFTKEMFQGLQQL